MQYESIIVNKKYPGINPLIFGTEKCQEGHSFGPYIRTYWLLHYVNSGCGNFCIHGQNFRVHPREIFVIPPYEETYYEADAVQPWHYTWIGFSSDIQLPEPFCKPVIQCTEANRIFDKMLQCDRYENGKSAYLAGCLWELVSVLSEQTKSNDNYVDKARSIIDSSYMNDLTVEKLAEQLNITRSYLFSLFKEETGMSPKQYLIKVRLERAAELMTVYNKGISISAQSVGYRDIYNFSKIFKSYFGISPRAYRYAYETNGQHTETGAE